MFGTLASAVLILGLLTTGTGSASCSTFDRAMGLCTTNDGSSVTVGGTQTSPGGDGSPSGPRGDAGSDQNSDQPSAPESSDQACQSDFTGVCDRLSYSVGITEDPLAAITITDLARFAPDGIRLTVEPEGVGVVGLPTNFVAPTRSQTAQGTLFGHPLSVRFTPASHVFSYGDGETRVTTQSGASWAGLDQAQFTPTGTSHVYTERGTYRAHVEVRYTAEVDIGTGWVPVPGEVTTTGPDYQLRIYEARTALVAHTCDDRPRTPGC